jgi:TRAP-type C4-dicarboxylate transport system substrate-binding protein
MPTDGGAPAASSAKRATRRLFKLSALATQMATGNQGEMLSTDQQFSIQGGIRMHTTRRTFLKGTAAAAAAVTLPAPAVLAQAPIELKMASFVPPMHSVWAGVLIPWAKDIEAKSGGKLKVSLYPSMQLGGKPPELYRQMVQGIADIVFTLPGYTSGDFPMMGLTELPGTATNAFDGTTKLWDRLKQGYFNKEYADAKILMLWNSDNAGLMTRSKAIRGPADVKGLRLRAPSEAQAKQIDFMGGTGVSMPVTQIYQGVERGTIDGTQIPLSAMIDFKLHEVVKHYTVNTPLGRSPFLVSMNKKRFEGLPADLRKIIDDTTGQKLSLKGAEDYDKQNGAALILAKKEGQVVELSKKDHDAWLAFFAPLIKSEAQRVDKLGLDGSKLVKSYGLSV